MRALALAFAVTLPTIAVAQNDDRGILTRFLEDNLSGAGREVRVIGFEGALSSTARIAEISIADAEGVWITLREVELSWNRGALFSGRLEVRRLVAGSVDLPRLPGLGEGAPSPEATPFALPDLPVSVEIGEVSAARVTLGADVFGTAVTLEAAGSASLAGGAGEARLAITRIDGPAGTLALDGAFSNITRNLRLDLVLSEAAGGIASTLIGVPGAPSLNLAITGEGPVDDFAARIRLAADGVERLEGTATVRDVAGGARAFALDIAGDIAPLFLSDYRDFFGDRIGLVVSGQRAATGALSLEALRLTAAQVRVEGRAEIAFDGLPTAFDLAIDLGAPDGTPVLLPLAGDPVRVGGATLRAGFNATSGQGWRLSGVLSDLAAPAVRIDRLTLDGSGRINRRPGGAQAVGGTLRFGAVGTAPTDAAVAAALGTALDGQVKFNWLAGEAPRFSEVLLTGADYGLAGNLAITTAEGEPRVSGRLTAEMRDFSRLSALAGRPVGGAGQLVVSGEVAPLSGIFAADLSVTGRDLRAGIAEVDRLLAGDSAIRLSATRGVAGVEIKALDVTAGTLIAQASGWLRTGGSEVSARLDFADLSVLGPAYRGALIANAKAEQANGVDRLTVTGTARDLAFGQPHLDGFLAGETTLALTAARQDDVIRVETLRIDGAAVAASASGVIGAALTDLAATFRAPDLSPAGDGYGGAISAEATYRAEDGVERATLDAVAQGLTVGQPEADKLLRGSSTISVAASRQNGLIRLDSLRLDGPQLTARAAAREGGNGDWRVDLTARLANLGLFVPEVPGALTLEGVIDGSAQGYRVDLGLTGPGGIDARAAGAVQADGKSADVTLRGQADTGLANAFIAPVSLRGPARFDMALRGPLRLSSLTGQVVVSQTRIAVPNPPVAFEGTEATITLRGGQADITARTRKAAGGVVSVDGRLALTAPFNADLSVGLRGVVQRDPQLYETVLDGALRVTGPLAGGALIAGQIGLGPTEVRIASASVGGVTAIPVLRHVNEPAAVRQTRARAGVIGMERAARQAPSRPFRLDVAITAPARVFVRGRGIDAELGGSLQLLGTTDTVIPVGGFELIRGRLDLLGRRFNLSGGRLAVEGDLIPRLSLVATAQSEDITASIIVEGRIDAPEIRFTSAPELPEEEVVARILFGRGLDQISALQAAQLASAVATLAGRGGAGLVDRLRQTFGLDDFDVSTTSGGITNFRAGKYLAENLYADVIIGTTGKSEINLNLDISPSFTIKGRATSDGKTGIGVYFERDY